MSWDPFLAEAVRVGRHIASEAIRSGDKATWLTDEIQFVAGTWQPVLATLGPDLAGGTAGVGWFLARLAAIANDLTLAVVATAALKHAVKNTDALISGGQLDWYLGASGVAWAAIDAGRALGSAELLAAGMKTTEAVVSATRGVPDGDPDPALVGGESGNIAGLLAIANISGNSAAAEAASVRAAHLANAVPVASWVPAPLPATPSSILQTPQLGAGLARGLSGVGLVLAATGWPDVARAIFTTERALFETGRGWVAPPAHAWLDSPSSPDASWCRGAAGIGLARLSVGTALADTLLLSEAGAAVELVRSHVALHQASDASLCHGRGGEIDLFATAGALFGEPIHTKAARKAGLALTGKAGPRSVSHAGRFGVRNRNPSLMFGLAGRATLLLRLHHYDSVPSPTLPPIWPSPAWHRGNM